MSPALYREPVMLQYTSKKKESTFLPYRLIRVPLPKTARLERVNHSCSNSVTPLTRSDKG